MDSHRPDQMEPPAIVGIVLEGKHEKKALGKAGNLFEDDNEDYFFVASDRLSWDKAVYHSPSAISWKE